jgi:hypothetical protein
MTKSLTAVLAVAAAVGVIGFLVVGAQATPDAFAPDQTLPASPREEPARDADDAGQFGPEDCAPQVLEEIKSSGMLLMDLQTVLTACDHDVPSGARRALAELPTPLQVLLADPDSATERFVLVHVAVSPSGYFNWGYGNARRTHFAFELRSILHAGGQPEGPRAYGYAEKAWARPFFQQVTDYMQRNGTSWAPATLVVGFLSKRMNMESVEQLEILAAELGLSPVPDPALVNQRLQTERLAAEQKRQAAQVAAASESAMCTSEKLRRTFISSCQGLYALGNMMGGDHGDSRPFCRCASEHVDYRKLRKAVMYGGCDIINSQVLVATINDDVIQNRCAPPARR